MKLRSGWVVLAGVFAVATVGTLGLVVAEMRYVSEQLVAVQERQDALDRQLSAERARGANAGGEAKAVAAEARERAAVERLAQLEAVVRSLEERTGKAAPSSKPPELPRPEVLRPAPIPAVTPAPRARPKLNTPKLAAASAPAPRAPAPSKAPVASDELSPAPVQVAKPAPLVKPAVARRPEPAAAETQPKLFAEPSRPSEPIADRRLGL
ncbi:MAG: hypothetical protein ABW217_05285 [Polyangiaceae bacterium]